MTFAQQLHAEHKARQARLGAVPTRSIVSNLTEAQILPLKLKPAAGIVVPPVEYFYPTFWCWDLVTMPRKIRPQCKTIQATVAAAFEVPVIEMRSSRRTNSVAIPRFVAMHLCKKLLDWSLPQIGRHFGGRDHTTVLHALRRVEAMMEMDLQFRAKVDGLLARFE